MKKLDNAFKLLCKIDKVYSDVVNGKKDVLEELDNLILEVLDYENINEYSETDAELIKTIINSFSIKVDLINRILKFESDNDNDLEVIRNKFKLLEAKRFEIVNNYVIGTVKKEDIDLFEKLLFGFRESLYAIPISDSNILEIAKMKSKIQHFETEVLEDEEVLRVAYANSN